MAHGAWQYAGPSLIAGIDLGTTNSLVAVWQDGHQITGAWAVEAINKI